MKLLELRVHGPGDKQTRMITIDAEAIQTVEQPLDPRDKLVLVRLKQPLACGVNERNEPLSIYCYAVAGDYVAVKRLWQEAINA